jgi:hypothetical protein
MLVADDYGHCDARCIYLRSHCYPVSEVSVDKVEKMLQVLIEKELVIIYEIEEKKYLEIVNFGQRLRSMRYKFPCPTSVGHVSDKCPPESESESESEVEVEGGEEKQPEKPADHRFKAIIEMFFKYYEHVNGIKYIPHAKDFAQLKNLLKADQGQTTNETFLSACRSCQHDSFHKKAFSLGYVAANYSKLINLTSVPVSEK